MKLQIGLVAISAAAFAGLANVAFGGDTQKPAPVSDFKDGFTLEQSDRFRNNRDLAEWLGGGDASVWVNLRPSEAFPATATVPNRRPPSPLPKNIRREVGQITIEADHFGKISLDDFMVHPDSRAQALMVVHKGQVVYESFPAMHPSDHHIWMSTSKVLASLVVDLLIDEGKIDPSKTVGTYLSALRGSEWEDIKVLDVLDMTTGLNVTDEEDGTFYKPGSLAQRMLSAEFGLPHEGRVEELLAVMKDARKVHEPGAQFGYSSLATQVLVMLAEAVTQERWAQIIDKKIWSRMGTEGPLFVHTTPTGLAVGHGMVSSRLSDFARFAMLYTPSWNKVSNQQVVSPEILERIQEGTRSKEFFMSGSGPTQIAPLGDDTMKGSSRQWDSVWPDGDLYKAGFMHQAIYVSPDRDLVIVCFSTSLTYSTIKGFLRPIATSGLFD